MRWPWRRRAKGGRVVFIGSSPFDVAAIVNAVPTPSPVVAAWIPDDEPAPTAEPAAPSVAEPVAGPVAAAVADPEPTGTEALLAALAAVQASVADAGPAAAPAATSPAPAADTPAAPAPVATPAASPAPASVQRAGVQLGFADGTVVTLDDDDPRAVALRAAAARLTSAN